MSDTPTLLTPCFARSSFGSGEQWEEANTEWSKDVELQGNGHNDPVEKADIVFNTYEDIDWVSKYWGPTRNIALESLASLVERHAVAIHGNLQPGRCSLLLRRNGVYNSAYILEFENGTNVCVRVPACGWSERWNEKDAKLLRSTALVMRLIARRTTVPLPTVIAYDTTLANEIGAPFLLMTYLEGNSARQAWNSDEWAVPKEIRRQNLLRSLAQAISSLGTLRYSKSGSLWFNDGEESEPLVGESWSLRVEGFVVKRDFEAFEPISSTRERVKRDLQKLLDDEGFPDNCRTVYMDSCQDISMKGVLLLYRVMVETFLDAAEFPESDEEFVLMHSDYDIQNLLVDGEGNLTGIFDWDGVASVPRQIGWSMLPYWLQQDWYSGYCWPPATGVEYAMLWPEQYEKYRRDFRRYMWEACGGIGDCRYTGKSHIYRAMLNSTADRYDAYCIVQNVLADILPRRRGMAYCNQIGAYGFRDGEKEWLQARLRKFFEPKVPTHPTHRQDAED